MNKLGKVPAGYSSMGNSYIKDTYVYPGSKFYGQKWHGAQAGGWIAFDEEPAEGSWWVFHDGTRLGKGEFPIEDRGKLRRLGLWFTLLESGSVADAYYLANVKPGLIADGMVSFFGLATAAERRAQIIQVFNGINGGMGGALSAAPGPGNTITVLRTINGDVRIPLDAHLSGHGSLTAHPSVGAVTSSPIGIPYISTDGGVGYRGRDDVRARVVSPGRNWLLGTQPVDHYAYDPGPM